MSTLGIKGDEPGSADGAVFAEPLIRTPSANLTREGLFFKRAFFAALRKADLRLAYCIFLAIRSDYVPELMIEVLTLSLCG